MASSDGKPKKSKAGKAAAASSSTTAPFAKAKRPSSSSSSSSPPANKEGRAAAAAAMPIRVEVAPDDPGRDPVVVSFPRGIPVSIAGGGGGGGGGDGDDAPDRPQPPPLFEGEYRSAFRGRHELAEPVRSVVIKNVVEELIGSSFTVGISGYNKNNVPLTRL